MKTSITPAPGVRGASAYSVPKHAAPTDLWLHGNEGAPPSPAVFDALSARDVGLLQRYPNARPLEAALAAKFGVDPAEVIVTAGGDDALDRAFRAFLWGGREVIIPEPTFVMLRQYARLVGATVREVAWPGGAFPLAEVCAVAGPNTGAIAIVSPNNPTGAVIEAAQLRALAKEAPGAALLVDLAYSEFADEDLSQVALELDNAIIFRTFSKAYGLAGIRVGYAIGPAPLIAYLRAAGNPYTVAAPSLALALARLEAGDGPMEAFVRTVREERATITAALVEAGAQVPASQGNFVFGRFATPAAAAWFCDALAGQGIRVRGFPTRRGLEDAVRVTCPGNDADCRRLVAAIGRVFDPGAWRAVSNADETRVARAEGAVPVGIAAAETDGASLVAAGAARVVGDLSELRRFSP